ncbi:MAG TPA: SPFH domain-containing protein [Nocardioides sp.]|nr:SPFH domain-containing protein [Nocardioides sp.]
MGVIVLTVVLVVIGLGALLAGRAAKRTLVRLIGAGALVLALVVFLGASFTQVHAKEIGVKVSFGKPVAELSPGIHFKWPWQSVTKVDETIFTDTYDGDSALPVRLGDGNTASVSATIRWHVDPQAADYIYQNYRSNNPSESLRDAVVDTQFKAAVNQVLSGFNPTANVQDLNFSPNYAQLADQVTASMASRVKDADGTSMVIVDGITVAGVQYSEATEARINSIVAQAAKTQQAIQSEKTARAQAKANEILQRSLKNNPYVLVSRCMDALANGDFTPPAGFSCWPGGGSSVVVPQAK